MSGEVRVTQSQSHHLTDGHVLELATRECAEIVDGVDGDDKGAGFWARISEGLESGGGFRESCHARPPVEVGEHFVECRRQAAIVGCDDRYQQTLRGEVGEPLNDGVVANQERAGPEPSAHGHTTGTGVPRFWVETHGQRLGACQGSTVGGRCVLVLIYGDEIVSDSAIVVGDDGQCAGGAENGDRHAGGRAQCRPLCQFGVKRAVGKAPDNFGLMLRPQRQRLHRFSTPQLQGREPQQRPRDKEDGETDENPLRVATVLDEFLGPGAGRGGQPRDQSADEGDDDAAAVDGVTREGPG